MVDVDVVLLVAGIILVMFVGILIGATIENRVIDIKLSHETADKICLDLTNESGVIAKDYEDFGEENRILEKGELYCQVPSYDETHLIKVGK